MVDIMLSMRLAMIGLVVFAYSAFAQNEMTPADRSSSSTMVGTGMMQSRVDIPSFGASADTKTLRHKDFTGAPCLQVSGYARAHLIDKNLFDHVVTVQNNCPQRIALSVCYYHSQECVPVEVPGHERKETILGTLPAQKDFRFEFREKF
jgi:hypothetical protein